MRAMRLTGAKAPLGAFLESRPAGWAVATFGDIAETQLGKMLSQKTRPAANPKPYLRNQNVQWGRFDLRDVWTLEIRPDEAKRFQLVAGDLLVCEGGEVGRAAIWNGEISECYYQKALHRVRPGPRATARYLYWILTLYRACDLFQGFSTGTTISHLPQEALRELPVPIPPVDEQRRLVAAIETVLSRHNSGAEGLGRVRQRAAALVRQILRSAVPIPGPSHWATVSVQEAGIVTLGRQRAPEYHEGSKMRPYLRVANVFEDRIDARDVMQMHFEDDDFQRYRLVVGDVLLNEGQSPELLGRPAIYRGIPENVAFTNSLLRFQANPNIDPEWALLVFRRHLHSGRFAKESRITTNIAHLSAGRFKTVEFPVPPLAEQRRIVQRTAAQLSALDKLISGIEEAQKRAVQLRSAILVAAFTGTLSLEAQVGQAHSVAARELAGVPD